MRGSYLFLCSVTGINYIAVITVERLACQKVITHCQQGNSSVSKNISIVKHFIHAGNLHRAEY